MSSDGQGPGSGPDFHRFASPLNGLPPLLAPQAGMSSSAGRMKRIPATTAIQSECRRSFVASPIEVALWLTMHAPFSNFCSQL